MQTLNYYDIIIKKHKGKLTVFRAWKDGWFPVNPTAVDIKQK